MVITLTFLTDIVVIVLGLGVLRTMIKGAPYVPTKQKAVQKMIDLAGIKPGQKAVDLGSGDGRIVIAFAQAGADSHGYEINPLLVWWSRWKIRKAGLEGKAFVHQKSFWNEDLSSYDVVALFGVRYIMKELGQKLEKELKSGAKIVSYGFSFPGWQYKDKGEGVLLYEKK